MKIKDDKKIIEQKFRRPYRKPHLCAYGVVKELTAGGTGLTVEAIVGKDMCSPSPKQQRC